MWNTALAVNTVLWSGSFVFLIYATGGLVLHGAWHQFLFAAILFAVFNISGVVLSILDQ